MSVVGRANTAKPRAEEWARSVLNALPMVRVLAIAILVAGCSFSGDRGPASPDCGSPAPLVGIREPQLPEIIVSLREGFNFSAEVSRLSDVYGFVPMSMNAELRDFFTVYDEADLPSLRCESTVQAVEYDGFDYPAATAR
jgi:hypothetical protein